MKCGDCGSWRRITVGDDGKGRCLSYGLVTCARDEFSGCDPSTKTGVNRSG